MSEASLNRVGRGLKAWSDIRAEYVGHPSWIGAHAALGGIAGLMADVVHALEVASGYLDEDLERVDYETGFASNRDAIVVALANVRLAGDLLGAASDDVARVFST